MQQTWRWFGPNDSVSLTHIKQTGATGIVSSLHQIPTGDVWAIEDILERKQLIENSGLEWSVIESIPVHNDIKSRQGNYKRYIENYKESIDNVAKAGIKVVCYNFMPVVDWARTNLSYLLPDKSLALRFEMTDFAAYDIFMLKRDNAELDYSPKVVSAARESYSSMSEEQLECLEKNIIAGLPGGEGSYTRAEIKKSIDDFIKLGEDAFRKNLFKFLHEIIPVAEKSGVRMCIHPDDPPFSLFGLPRVVSTAEDIRELLAEVPSASNGLTLCAGSLGTRKDNDLVAMVKEFGPSIHFVHLRNVTREEDGSFYESGHLDGDNDMIELIRSLLEEEKQRRIEQRMDIEIPIRPDHGHLMTDDITGNNSNPGYSLIGRLKGLAEMRGVIQALTRTVNT